LPEKQFLINCGDHIVETKSRGEITIVSRYKKSHPKTVMAISTRWPVIGWMSVNRPDRFWCQSDYARQGMRLRGVRM